MRRLSVDVYTQSVMTISVKTHSATVQSILDCWERMQRCTTSIHPCIIYRCISYRVTGS